MGDFPLLLLLYLSNHLAHQPPLTSLSLTPPLSCLTSRNTFEQTKTLFPTFFCSIPFHTRIHLHTVSDFCRRKKNLHTNISQNLFFFSALTFFRVNRRRRRRRGKRFAQKFPAKFFFLLALLIFYLSMSR